MNSLPFIVVLITAVLIVWKGHKNLLPYFAIGASSLGAVGVTIYFILEKEAIIQETLFYFVITMIIFSVISAIGYAVKLGFKDKVIV